MNNDYPPPGLSYAQPQSDLAGWSLLTPEQEALQGPQTWIYLWDLPTQWLWACCMHTTDFRLIAQRLKAGAEEEKNEARQILGNSLSLAADGRPLPPSPDGMDWREGLAIAGAAYAGTTKTFDQIPVTLCNGCHFIVLNYRDADQTHSLLRPAMITGNDIEAPLPAADLAKNIDWIVDQDRARHPEWFTMTTATTFKSQH